LYHGGLFTEGAEANGNPIRAPYEGNAADQRAVNKEVFGSGRWHDLSERAG
jgi:hypothetical protein